MHKRTSGVLARTNWLMPIAALSMALLGCPGQELAPLSPCTVSAVTERVDQTGVSDVDLLFMIDNSGSMAPKQQKLADQLPRLLQVLTQGDRCAGQTGPCAFDENSKPKRMFTAAKSLHIGVVTSNMGGIDDPKTQSAGVLSCGSNNGLGDDGKLQNRVDIATDGVIATKGEFQNYAADQPVIPGDPTCGTLGDVPRYQEYVKGDPDLTAENALAKFRCVARVGVRGCPFEQQLESPWKALAPSNQKGDDYTFLNGTKGNGDGYNAGFLRDDAILAVLLVTDEDDCSITTNGKGLFDIKDPNLNLLCGQNYQNTDLVHDVSRYKRGFQSLKPDNEDRVIFAAITGVPEEAISAKKTYDEILALPEMQFTEDPAMKGLPTPSCFSANGKEVAYPPIRIVQVAKDFGTEGILFSVCSDNFAPALDLLIEKIASKLKGNCLPRKLSPDEKGHVNCQVFELLPKDKTKCDANFGHIGNVVQRSIRENGKVTNRAACEMAQVSVSNNQPESGQLGWYYDNFSTDVIEQCSEGEKQRITFKFADGTSDLPSGAGATFECFQPVSRIDKDATGFDAVNISCVDDDKVCDDKSEKTDKGYKLICVEPSKTCQISCKSNPNCPPGWVCAGADGKTTTTPQYCQQPTCPQDNKPAS